MATGSVWGIDIGKSSLKAVRMSAVADELEIQALAHYEYEINDDGSISPAESTRALEDLIARYPQAKKEPVYVSLPGHAAFARFIKLPPFDENKLAEMVRFEAQQQIPFPIEEVNWDYTPIERDYEADEERDIGLFAIKRELVETFLADLKLSGIEPELVTIAPLASYNYIVYDVQPEEDKLTLVLDIGWEHSDLIIVDGDRFWVRNLALNGNELTRAIATKLRLPFGAAEELKRNVGTSKSQAKSVYQATQLVLRDFVAEIQRSVGFYKSQNRGRRLDLGEVVLLGRGARLPNIQPFFQKELGSPVTTVNRLSNLALDVDLDGDEVELLKDELPSFCVALGLAIQGCDEGIAEANLLPEEILQRKRMEKKKPLVIAAVALIWVAVLLSYFMHQGDLQKAKDVLEEAKKHLVSFERFEDDIRDLKNVAGDHQSLREAGEITSGRSYPLELVNLLARALPKDNGSLVEVTAEQQRELDTKGRDDRAIQAVATELRRAQVGLNSDKAWILDISMESDRSGARATLTVARTFILDETGQANQVATLAALEQGILRDIQQVLPGARFDDTIPTTIYALLPDETKPPTTGLFSGSSYHEYLSQKIVIIHPHESGQTSGAGTDGAGADGGEGQ